MALSLREKRLVIGAVLIGGVVAFYNYVHEPLFAKRAEAAELQQQVGSELKRDQSRLNKEGNLRARKEAVAAREKVIDAWVPGKNSAALFIWYLSQGEMTSGAKITGITVGDRKQVKAAPNAQAQPGAQPNPAANAPPAAAPAAPAAPGAQPAPGPDSAPTLIVVNLELKVKARFAQHLLFNQALEEMPLFLNTDSLAITNGASPAFDQMGKLIQGGNLAMAARLLGTSPELEGTYHLALYFKGDKLGPTTDPMQFSEDAGKMDPYAMGKVDEFLNTVVPRYSGTPGDTSVPPGTAPGMPDQQPGEMG